MWTEAQHESNASISAVAIEQAESAPVKIGGRIGKREVQFPALGCEKGEGRRVLLYLGSASASARRGAR